MSSGGVGECRWLVAFRSAETSLVQVVIVLGMVRSILWEKNGYNQKNRHRIKDNGQIVYAQEGGRMRTIFRQVFSKAHKNLFKLALRDSTAPVLISVS